MGCWSLYVTNPLRAAAEGSFKFTAGLSGFAIFIAVTNLLLSLFLLLVPVAYEKYDKFNRLARALKEDRVAFILVGWGTITMFLIAFVSLSSLLPECLTSGQLHYYHFRLHTSWMQRRR